MLHRLGTVVNAAARRRNACGAALAACLLVAVCAVAPTPAQYRFDAWTADDGLPQNIVRAIRQTRDGYLWLATSDGLVRFDGARFTVFDKSNSPGINSNRFNCLHEDAAGALWIGTENGGVTRYSDGRFVTYTTESGLPNNFIRGITGDDSGNLWVLSAEQIMRWDGARFTPADLDGLATGFNESGWDTGVFWGADASGLHRFARGRLTTRTLPGDLLRRIGDRFGEDASGALWIELRDGAIAKVEAGGETRVFEPGKESGDEGRALLAPGAWFTDHDPEGRFWKFEVGRELTRSVMLPSAGQMEKVSFNGLSEDREGNVWLGTDGRGLYRVRKQDISVYSEPQGLAGRNVYPVLEDCAGDVWIGAWQGGLSRFRDGAFTNYTTENGLASNLLTAIYEDRGGRLWVAAHRGDNGGLRVRRDDRFVPVEDQIVPERTSVAAIYQDRTGAFWFGTTRGLIRYENGASTIYTTKDGLAGDDVNSIVEDGDQLWIGSYGGLTRLRGGEFTSWKQRDGLPSDSVRALYLDSDGVLWVGTYDGGLGRFADGRFTRYTTREGLFNNGVFQILEDRRGNLWMSCNRGIYRASKQELNEYARGGKSSITSIAYGKSDGMLNAECNGGKSPAGAKARDGKLWFPTQDGVAVIDPEAIDTNDQPPPVMIESLLIDRDPVAFDRPVQIAPGRENFEIGYTALSFVNSHLVKFKYKLEGLDRDWVDAGTRRAAYYSHVPPGSYTFRVIAANSDGVWNTEGKSLAIVVLPPFYRTWWFVSLAVLCSGAAVTLAFRRRIARFEREREQQQEFSRGLIASQEAERKRIAAELHDSLGQNLLIIKNRAVLSALKQSDERARGDFDEISTSVSQTLEEVRSIAWNLRPSHLDQLGLRTALVAMIEKVEASCETDFACDIDDIDGAFAPADEIIIYRIVQESLNNIVKHARARRALVRIERRGREVQITISDDGRGFEPGDAAPEAAGAAISSRAAPNASRGLPKGFGLTGIAERVRMLGGVHAVDSAAGRGTTVSVKLRLPG